MGRGTYPFPFLTRQHPFHNIVTPHRTHTQGEIKRGY